MPPWASAAISVAPWAGVAIAAITVAGVLIGKALDNQQIRDMRDSQTPMIFYESKEGRFIGVWPDPSNPQPHASDNVAKRRSGSGMK